MEAAAIYVFVSLFPFFLCSVFYILLTPISLVRFRFVCRLFSSVLVYFAPSPPRSARVCWFRRFFEFAVDRASQPTICSIAVCDPLTNGSIFAFPGLVCGLIGKKDGSTPDSYLGPDDVLPIIVQV